MIQLLRQRILIVDDEPYNLLGLLIILKLSFKELNYKESIVNKFVDRASNGLEALNMVKMNYLKKNVAYGLIFMDCSMPIMNGYDSSVLIRKYYT